MQMENEPNSGDPDETAEVLSDSMTDESLLESLRLVIPGYEIIDRIADGGQGSVFKALRQSDRHIVAIKTIRHGQFASKESRVRFRREVNALEILRCPGIVGIIESGETRDGCKYIVTEFIDGQHLDKYANSLPESKSLLIKLRVMIAILKSIDVAHKRGIVHRDLSPSNILIDRAGNAHVIDFGLARSAFDAILDPIAKVSETGSFFGKLDFASPEQIDGTIELSQSSDVYSMGVILYFLLSNGRLPFNHGGGNHVLASRIIFETPDPLTKRSDISRADWKELCSVIERAMSKLPEDRYQMAGEMARALIPILASYEATLEREESEGNIVTQPPTSVISGSTPMASSTSITSYHTRMRLVDWAKSLRDILKTREDEYGVEQIDVAIEEFLQDRFTIAVIGKAKRGKSTLLNAMLGRKDDLIAPTDKLPASNAITKIFYDEDENAEVVFQDGSPSEDIGFESIKDYVTEEYNPKNRKNVACVNVSGPFPGLERDLALVDTPGADSLHEHHDALLHEFIPNADAVIFLVSARMPIDEKEKELLRRLKSADVKKVFFAINRIDELSSADLQQAVQHNGSELGKVGISVSKIHEISALRAFNGDFAASGLASLASEMQKFLAEHKGRVICERFINRIQTIAVPVCNGLEVELNCAQRSNEELESELVRLKEQYEKIEEKRKYGEREFLNQWRKAVDAFEVAVPNAKDSVWMKVKAQIDKTSSLGIGTLTKELPTLISEEVELATSPIAYKFESTVRDACRKYAESIPAIEIGSFSATMPKTQGSSVLPAALGGTSAAAAGGVLLNAAAAYIPATATTVVTGSTAPVAYQATAGIVGTCMSYLGSLFGHASTSAAGASVSGMFTTTTATTSVAATPIWVTLAGPVGWTMIGVGAIAIPIAWQLSKLKQKDKVLDAAEKEIERLFQRLLTERAGALRNLGEAIATDIQLSLERDHDQVQKAITGTIGRQPSPVAIDQLKRVAADFNSKLKNPPGNP